MTEDTTDGRSRDEEGRMAPESTLRDILDVFEKHGEENIKTSTVKEELGYGTPGMIKRLRQHPEYFEEEDLGQGNPILWSLRYTRRDFLNALDELDDLTPTNQIAEHVGCSIEVAREWLFKLEDEDEIVSKPMGSEHLIWAKKPG